MRNKAPDIRILTVRGQKVVLDSDLARVYGVMTRRLNEQFRRNRQRFPADFAFQLSVEEYESLRSQIATLDEDTGKGAGSKSRKLRPHRESAGVRLTVHGCSLNMARSRRPTFCVAIGRSR